MKNIDLPLLGCRSGIGRIMTLLAATVGGGRFRSREQWIDRIGEPE
jgi:hypothetical protein